MAICTKHMRCYLRRKKLIWTTEPENCWCSQWILVRSYSSSSTKFENKTKQNKTKQLWHSGWNHTLRAAQWPLTNGHRGTYIFWLEDRDPRWPRLAHETATQASSLGCVVLKWTSKILFQQLTGDIICAQRKERGKRDSNKRHETAFVGE